jgi:hypothetical protein
MLQRGDIVVERLTGRRAMVINVANGEELTCRFPDGRLEDRFSFEVEPTGSFLESMVSALLAPFASRTTVRPPAAVNDRVRPLLVRQPGS